MSGFIEVENRHQRTLLPQCLAEYVAEDNPVRVVDLVITALDVSELGFNSEAKNIGRPGNDPRLLLRQAGAGPQDYGLPD